MARGKVKKWNPAPNGYIGTIIDDADGQECFFGDRALRNVNPKDVHPGMVVEFDRGENDRGPIARNVHHVSAPGQAQAPRNPPSGGSPQRGQRPHQQQANARPRDNANANANRGADEMLRKLPIPSTTAAIVNKCQAAKKHPGLVLDKFLLPVPNQEDQKERLTTVCSVFNAAADQSNHPHHQTLLAALKQRETRESALERAGLSVRRFTATTSGPLTLHLARTGALENAGLCLHRMFAFPELIGPGLKGMARAYAETVWLPTQIGKDWETTKDTPETNEKWNRALDTIDAVFGFTPFIKWAKEDRKKLTPFFLEWLRRLEQRSKKRSQPPKPDNTDEGGDSDRGAAKTAQAGGVVFHDAWPTKWPTMIVDITNNHHPEYYQGTDNTHPPGDWESPVPVYFLALEAGATFSFALSARTSNTNIISADHLALAEQWLIGALTHSGAGAKTHAGYGRFTLGSVQHRSPELGKISHIAGQYEITVKLQIVTPAFLGNAEATVAEKDALRVPTVIGMLRWWWRAINTNFTVEQLRAKEAEIFGGITSGTGLGVSITHDESITKKLEKGWDAGPPGSALGYLGYGPIQFEKRNENDKRNRTQRDAIDCQSEFVIQLRHRNESHLHQAINALWVWCALGGIGARNRRGWGSVALLTKLPQLSLPHLLDCKSTTELVKSIQVCLTKLVPNSKLASKLEWTAWGADSKLCASMKEWTNSLDALRDIGAKFQGFRSKYGGNRGGGKPGPDYHLTKDAIINGSLPRLPERAAFGMPYSQDFNSLKASEFHCAEFTPVINKNSQEKDLRRASPLLFKVFPVGEHYVWLVAFLPVEFLPSSAEIRANRLQRGRGHRPSKLTGSPFASPPPKGVLGGQKGHPTNKDSDSTVPASSTLILEFLKALCRPNVGDSIQVELLNEKTKKGGWKAIHHNSGMIGSVQNSTKVPTDKKPGDIVTLIVKIANDDQIQFEWPKEK